MCFLFDLFVKLKLAFALLLFGVPCLAQISATDIDEFEKIKPYLRVRIYGDAIVTQKSELSNMITRVDLEGTTTLLMVDHGRGCLPVFKTSLKKWNKTVEDLFRAALSNIEGEKMEKTTNDLEVDGKKIEFYFLKSKDQAASYVLDLKNKTPDLIGEWGSVMVVPNEGLVAMCKVSRSHPMDFMSFIFRIRSMTDKAFAEHSVPISKDFYWYNKGKFTLLNLTFDDKGDINLALPKELSEFMTIQN